MLFTLLKLQEKFNFPMIHLDEKYPYNLSTKNYNFVCSDCSLVTVLAGQLQPANYEHTYLCKIRKFARYYIFLNKAILFRV